jgi:Lon protease-like protein
MAESRELINAIIPTSSLDGKRTPMEAKEKIISLFPLPATVFFPGTLLPLHVFEPRYKQMMADAVKNDRLIGMVLLKPGWESNYYANPDLVSVGCLGHIDKYTLLPDEKYNLVLRGLSRFRLLKEIPGKTYRRAEVQLLSEVNDQTADRGTHESRDRLIEHCQEYVRLLPEGHRQRNEMNWRSFQKLSELVDQMAFKFHPTVEQKQSLLEELDVNKRAQFIHDMLDMKIRLINISKNFISKGTDLRMN